MIAQTMSEGPSFAEQIAPLTCLNMAFCGLAVVLAIAMVIVIVVQVPKMMRMQRALMRLAEEEKNQGR